MCIMGLRRPWWDEISRHHVLNLCRGFLWLWVNPSPIGIASGESYIIQESPVWWSIFKLPWPPCALFFFQQDRTTNCRPWVGQSNAKSLCIRWMKILIKPLRGCSSVIYVFSHRGWVQIPLGGMSNFLSSLPPPSHPCFSPLRCP